MNSVQTRVIGAAAFFLMIFLSGFWLGRSDKPYNALKLNLHKLIGLGGGVFLGFTLYSANQAASFSITEVAAIAVNSLLIMATVAAGGLVSIEKPMPAVVTALHKLLPYLTVLSTGVTLFLLFSGR